MTWLNPGPDGLPGPPRGDGTGVNDVDEFLDPQSYDARYAPPGTTFGGRNMIGTTYDGAFPERYFGQEAEILGDEIAGDALGDDAVGSVYDGAFPERYFGQEAELLGDALGEDEIAAATDAQRPPDAVGSVYDDALPERYFGQEVEILGDDAVLGEDGDDLAGLEDDAALGFAGEDAVLRTVAVARDRRRPAPPMRVAGPPRADDWLMAEVVVGAEDAGYDAFPVLKGLLQKCGGDVGPRRVRVDTHESYRRLRAAGSPELRQLAARVDALAADVAAHAADPRAHDRDVDAFIEEGVADVGVFMGEALAAAEERKVRPWLARRFAGKVDMWYDPDGEHVCASVTFPGGDGELRVMTSVEPLKRALAEVSRYAAEAGVPVSAVVGYVPAIAGVLAGATAVKEMAAAAPEVAKHPGVAARAPFEVTVEPKASPAFCALCALAWRSRGGDAAAAEEWGRLGSLSPAPLRQAMKEALDVVRQATGAAA